MVTLELQQVVCTKAARNNIIATSKLWLKDKVYDIQNIDTANSTLENWCESSSWADGYLAMELLYVGWSYMGFN